MGHPQEASLGHHCEVRAYTSFLKKKYYFGVDHFQVPPRPLQRFLKFFWGGACVRPDLTVSCEDPVWTQDFLLQRIFFVVGSVCIRPELTATVKNQSGRPEDKCREGGGYGEEL